jgi:hypothetical protein
MYVSSVTISIGSGLNAVLELSQAGYGGSFTAASSSCFNIVSSAVVARDNSGDYDLTIVPGQTGSCTLNLSSSNQGAGTLGVTVVP